MSIESQRIITKFLKDDTWAASASSPLAISMSGGRVTRCFFEGPRIYSYGKHFELARKVRVAGSLQGEVLLINAGHPDSRVTNEQLHDLHWMGNSYGYCVISSVPLGKIPANPTEPLTMQDIVNACRLQTANELNAKWEAIDAKRKSDARERSLEKRRNFVAERRESIELLQKWCAQGGDWGAIGRALDISRQDLTTIAELMAASAGMEERLRADHAANHQLVELNEPLLRELYDAGRGWSYEEFASRITNGGVYRDQTPMARRQLIEAALVAASILNGQQMAANHKSVANVGVLGGGRLINVEKEPNEVACES